MMTKFNQKRSEGFTLVEAVVGLVMFAAAAAGLVPLIMISRTFALQSDSRIGGIAVAQQVMDSLRQVDVACIPSSGTEVTKLPSKNCPTTPPTTPTSTGDSVASMPYKGKIYSATITYCENSDYCDTSKRHIRVKVYQDGNTAAIPTRTADAKPIYQLETVYARLQ
jgi:type II secretory pathway pseudopilin PulG